MTLTSGRFELVLLDGSGKHYPLPPSGEVLVGTAAECGIRLLAADVSRRHALLTLRRGVVSVRDLGSKNGTFVGGQRVREAVLRAGDVVRFSSVLAQLMPGGLPAEEESESGRSRPQGRADGCPTQELEAADPLSDFGWLLARWGSPDLSPMAVTLEWILRAAKAQGVVALQLRGEERVVLGAGGEVSALLRDEALMAALAAQQASLPPLETLAVEGEWGRVVAVRCPEGSWLLLLAGEGNPTPGELALFLRALTVARRLER